MTHNPEAMKPEIKARWTQALRSGEYPQTTETLKDDDGYCCLGVLCELAVQDGVIEPSFKVEYTDEWAYASTGSDGVKYDETSVLPTVVMEWAGLTSSNPHIMHDEMCVPISDPNDNHVPFSEIADIIDQQL